MILKDGKPQLDSGVARRGFLTGAALSLASMRVFAGTTPPDIPPAPLIRGIVLGDITADL